MHSSIFRRGVAGLLALGLALSLAGCSSDGPATVWTDTPEIALYAELFNASQKRYRVEVRYKADLAQAIHDAKQAPDLAVGRYLKSSVTRDRFQSLDYLFGELTVNQASFYPSLLAFGNLDGRQILLPVSFDLPALIFAQGGSANSKGKFLLGLDDIAAEAHAYNKANAGSATRMGFSPRWDPDFLVYAMEAQGADFREGKPLAWNEASLDGAVDGLRSWTLSTNGSATEEEDFQFKYLYTPAYKYIADGRALFAYMPASSFFLVPEEKRGALDYRWFSRDGLVPVSSGLVCAAIPRAGRNKPAAEAFLQWFFKDDNQKAMLESARKSRELEGSFGIAGGLSAVRSVTERVFPRYYPALVGHLPPEGALLAPDSLPNNWPELKAKVVVPWLLEFTSKPEGGGPAGEELRLRLAAYLKNRGR
jgi:ABC-type glycerol-3-phosphate transport system substrate-binding protein